MRTVFPTISRVTLYGVYGPYQFFMISGFVVLMSAWGGRCPRSSRPASPAVPAYWFAVLFIAGVLLLDRDLIPVWREFGFAGVALNMTMLQSAFASGTWTAVFWTLWVELKFYVLGRGAGPRRPDHPPGARAVRGVAGAGRGRGADRHDVGRAVLEPT